MSTDTRRATRRTTVAAQRPSSATKPATAQRPRSQSDQAYEQLEELIVTLQLPPGSDVTEAKLVDRLGIGRTPVREALQRLARENLVVALPQRGYLVSHIDVRTQLRLLETRREVERLIARCAARRASPQERERFDALAETFEKASRHNDATTFIRADREFNALCLEAARNEFAAGAMQLMHGLSRRFWYMHWRQAADMPVTARDHAAMARAIAAGDEDGAGRGLGLLLGGILAFTKATLTTDF